MEVNGYNHFEQSYLINELTQGMELAMQLRDQMGPQYSAETKEILLQQIVSSYDKALSILGCGAPAEQPLQLLLVQSPVMPSTPSSIVESPNGNDLNMRSKINQKGKECSLKRKSASTWTKQFKLSPENGLDGPPDDGHSWRKYGQKDIHGAKNPRSYYRCTYRGTQNCSATRQVQRSDKDSTVFDITYRGKHTCSMIRRSKSAPTSPGNQEPNQEDLVAEHQQVSAMLLRFQNAPPPPNNGFPSMELSCIKSESPTMSTSTVNNNNNNNFNGSISTSLISPPSTSGSNYFAMSPCNLDNIANVQHQQHSMGADLADMMLAATSSTNSPTIDPDFLLNQWSFNSNFSFDDPGFFPEQKGFF